MHEAVSEVVLEPTSAARAGHGVHREPGHAEGEEVTKDGATRNLELAGQVVRGQAAS